MKRLRLFFFLCVLVIMCDSCSPRVFFTVDSDSIIEYDRHNDVFRVVWKWSAVKGGVPEDTTQVNTAKNTESADSIR